MGLRKPSGVLGGVLWHWEVVALFAELVLGFSLSNVHETDPAEMEGDA